MRSPKKSSSSSATGAAERPAYSAWAAAKIYSTGHGFLNTDNAAEFSYKWQQMRADAFSERHFLWRPDCESNPCSPQLGTWQYDRAGWCPGDKAEPWTVDLSDWITAGAGEIGRRMCAERHTLPVAQEQSLVARAARNSSADMPDSTPR